MKYIANIQKLRQLMLNSELLKDYYKYVEHLDPTIIQRGNYDNEKIGKIAKIPLQCRCSV